MELLELWIIEFVEQSADIIGPTGIKIAGVLYVLGIVFKIASALITAMVLKSPGTADNEKWDRIRATRIYRATAWVLDLFLRLRIPKPKKKK